jgi:DNA-binding SARP family transcriptional activator/Tfp pilus assembly protein PilF
MLLDRRAVHSRLGRHDVDTGVYGGRMRFTVLGPVQVEVEGRVLDLRRRQTRCLLGVLLLDLDRRVSVDRLAELLWDGDPPENARRSIQDQVWRLRRVLAGAGVAGQSCQLVTVGDGYRLHAPAESVDAHQFRRLVDSAQAIAGPAGRVEQLRRALDLWRGPVLDQAAGDWLRQRLGAELEQRRLLAWEDLTRDSLTLQRERTVLPELAALVAEHPGRERLVDLYLQALHRVGRKADALDVYARTRAYLADELGIDPGPALRERHRMILRDDPAPQPAAPDPTVTIVPRQLPASVGRFVGRSDELAVLDRPHDASTVVISAIDGMAGIGKTALAVHAAHRVADRYPDGQLFIDLHGYTQGVAPVNPAEALDHALRALGVPGSQIPATMDQRAALYRSRLAEQRMLIVLDNAATESQVLPLLPGAPGCLVLVTSRRRLAGVDHTHAVSLDTLPTDDAVTLFLETAGTGRVPDQPPALLTELVELCGRLPLAIRIAAARLRTRPTWKLSQLVALLRDEQHRLSELAAGERSVTAALDLSYQQLNPEQQRTYRLLGLHPGADIDGYATAALLDVAQPHASRMLDQLHDVHLLLEPAAGRYRFHDLTRAHAARTAARDQDEPSRNAPLDRLLDYYQYAASLAMDAAYPYEREHRPQVPPTGNPAPDLTDRTAALGWLDTELPNLLAAAGSAAEHGKTEHLLHLSTILYRHLETRGRYRDAETLHHQALVAARADGHQAGQVAGLNDLGRIYWRQGRHPEASECFDRAVVLARAIGDRVGEVTALAGLGRVDLLQGRYPQATDRFGQALRLARAAGDRTSELTTLDGIGHIHIMHGRYADAARHYQQALHLARTTGHSMGELSVLGGLGLAQRMQGRYADAARHYQQALHLARATGHSMGTLSVLSGLGDLHRIQGRYAQAINDYQQVLDLAQATADRNYEFEAEQGLGRLRHATGDPQAAATHHHRALALADELDQPHDQARAHDGLAHAHYTLGQPGQARGHWQRALDILVSLDIDRADEEETSVEAIRARLTNLAQ